MKLIPALLLIWAASLPPTVPTHAAPTVAAPDSAAPAKAAGLDTPAPAQASVAAKMAFGTVPESSKALTEALDAKALTAAAKLTGKPGSFTGTVTKVYSPKNHGFVALDFAASYHDALTANIASADYAKFPDLM